MPIFETARAAKAAEGARQGGSTGPNNTSTGPAQPAPQSPAATPTGPVDPAATVPVSPPATQTTAAPLAPPPAPQPATSGAGGGDTGPNGLNGPGGTANVSRLPIHDKGMAERYLAALDFGATKFSFQTFADSGDSPGQTLHGTLAEFWPEVAKLNTPQVGAGAYVTINKTDLKGRKAKNVVLPRGLFADADSVEQVRHCISVFQTCDCPPSMAVKTGNGCHFYWLADDIPLDQFSKLQKQLADKLGTDGKIIDLPRVLRLPGTLHLKNPAKPKLITLLNQPGVPIQRWSLAELVSKFGLSFTASKSATAHTGLIPGLSTGPAAAFAGHGTDESLSDGIKAAAWFGDVSDEHKDEAADHAMEIIATHATLLEIGKHGGDNNAYYKLITSLARSGAPHAKDIFVKYASRAKDADSEEKLEYDFDRCAAGEFTDPNGEPITVGTLLKLAMEHGADFNKWKAAIPPEKVEARDSDLAELNRKHCVITDLGGKCVVANEVLDRKSNEKTVTLSSFETIANRYRHRKRIYRTTEKNEAGEEEQKEKKISLGMWWLNNKYRRECETVVFAPGRDIPGAYNLWRGFKFDPDFIESASKCGLYLEHILENICQGDRFLYNYVICWMANAVQNPDVPGQTALVLRGEMGTGKSEFARHFGNLFGENYLKVVKAKHITGTFNGHMGKCIVLFGDECFNRAGDPEQEDILKDLITAPDGMIEFKGFEAKRYPSCMHLIIAANREWVVPVRLGDRRFCCMEAGTAHRQDRPYFTAIIDQMRAGGYAALLGYLLKVDLTGWNPEAIPETKERQHQKRLTASDGDNLIIDFAQDGHLPGGIPKYPHIAKANDNEYGLLEVMRKRGGRSIAQMSDQSLTGILKDWKFNRKHRNAGSVWEAPSLPDLRKAISDKYPDIEFDNRPGWGQSIDDEDADEIAAGTAAVDEAAANKAKANKAVAEIKHDLEQE
jgi:hypothetical protein